MAAELPADWSPRTFRAGDEEGILRVLQSAFDRWPRGELAVAPMEHLRWKLSSDAEALRHHKVAEVDGKIVGVALTIVQQIKIGDQVLPGWKGADSATDPDVRSAGVMTAMREFAKDRPRLFQIFFGVRSGHEHIQRLRRLDVGVGFHTEADILVCAGGPEAEPPSPFEAGSIVPLPRFDARTDEFWREAAKPFAAMPSRDSDYLNWRYCDPRAGAFELKAMEHEGRILGWVVFRTSYGKGYIADLLALPGRLDVASALLADAAAALRRAGATEVQCWCPANHPYRALLEDAGFSQKRRTVAITFQTTRPGVESLLAPVQAPGALVHFMLGDSDLI